MVLTHPHFSSAVGERRGHIWETARYIGETLTSRRDVTGMMVNV